MDGGVLSSIGIFPFPFLQLLQLRDSTKSRVPYFSMAWMHGSDHPNDNCLIKSTRYLLLSDPAIQHSATSHEVPSY